MSKRPQDYTKAQLIDLVSNLEAQLNDTYGVDEAPDNDITSLMTQLKSSAQTMDEQMVVLYEDIETRNGQPTVESLQESIASLEAELATVRAEAAANTDAETIAGLREALAAAEAQLAAPTTGRTAVAAPGITAGELAKGMHVEGLDQPIYITLHGQTHDLADPNGVQACRESLSNTLAESGIMLARLMQHRHAQELFRELSSSLPGGGHNTARMAKLGQAIGTASQRLRQTYVDGRTVSQLVGRLTQERGLIDQCIQVLTSLDMETRRHGKGDSF